MPTMTNLSADPKDAQDPRPRSLANASAPVEPDDTALTPTETPVPTLAPPPPNGIAEADYLQRIRARGGRGPIGALYQKGRDLAIDGLGNLVSPILDTAALPVAGSPTGSNAAMGVGQDLAQRAGRLTPPDLQRAGQVVGGAAGGALGAAGGPAGVAGAAGLGTYAGGLVGGALDAADPVAGLKNAAVQSIVPALLTGGTAGLASKATQMGQDRVEAKVSQIGAQRLQQVMPMIAKLKGVFNGMPGTPEGVRAFFLDPIEGGEQSTAQTLLSRQQQAADDLITKTVQGTGVQFPDPLTITSGVPKDIPPAYLRAGNTAQDWAKLSKPAQDALKAQLPVSADKYGVSWQDFRKNLSELGSQMKSAQGRELGSLKQQYAEAIRGAQAALTKADPSGKATQAFNDAQGAYEAGQKLIDEVSDTFTGGGKRADRVIFHVDRMLKSLSDNATGSKGWAGALDSQGYQALVSTLRPGWQPGTTDIYGGTHTGLSPTISEHIPMVGYLRGRIGSPQLAGQNPLAFRPQTQAGIGGLAAGASGLITPELQGLPLPGRNQ